MQEISDSELPEDFAIFILTHGRPDNVKTISTLERSGYRGKIYFIVDDLDKTVSKYIENFGEANVIVFDKMAEASKTDSADTLDDMRTITYARNASFQIARDLGLKYFMQLDDDYTKFEYRFNDRLRYKPEVFTTVRKNPRLDDVLAPILKFYKNVNVATVAISQGGDWIGGENSSAAKAITPKRKAMNSFICSVDRQFRFVGRMNEDVNTYTSLGSRGVLFLTINQVSLTQMGTQSSEGGITELYKSFGTYVKSFYTIMFHPSSVKISQIGNARESMRIHHAVKWKNTVPMIIRETCRASNPA